jgi:hypothetical protein
MQTPRKEKLLLSLDYTLTEEVKGDNISSNKESATTETQKTRQTCRGPKFLFNP